MKAKVLVTGANGQLGKTLKELYSKNDAMIDFTFTSKEVLDITNKKHLNGVFKNDVYDYCINCAAYTNVEQAEKTPEIAFKINGEALALLAKMCKKAGIVLIHISTDYVFDGASNQPYTIESPTHPINKYGESKLLGEKYIKETLKNYFIIRTSWLYSKKHGNNFYKTIVNKAIQGQTLRIITNQLGCPTDAVNLSKYIYNIIANTSIDYGIKHFCDKDQLTWYDFAIKILEENDLLRTANIVREDNYSTFAKRPKYSVLKN